MALLLNKSINFSKKKKITDPKLLKCGVYTVFVFHILEKHMNCLCIC